MQRAWMQAHLTVARSARPSKIAGGVAGSFLEVIQRLGWPSPWHDSVFTADRTLIILSDVAPRTTRKYLMDDYHIATAAATKILYPEQAAAFGGPERQGGGNTRWHLTPNLKSKFATENGRLIPWFDPIALVLNAP